MLTPLRFISHGKHVQNIAQRYGWRPGARYTNLRDVYQTEFSLRGFLDINWKNYSFRQHLTAVKKYRPHITVARDIINIDSMDEILEEAGELQKYVAYVVIVPKDTRLANIMNNLIPEIYLLGYSCPTRYGSTRICPEKFRRPVHLLGGRPDVQRKLANVMPVYSFDCNRFTYDAAFGDYFDGKKFRHLGIGGYEECLQLSLRAINSIWEDYRSIGR